MKYEKRLNKRFNLYHKNHFADYIISYFNTDFRKLRHFNTIIFKSNCLIHCHLVLRNLQLIYSMKYNRKYIL